MLACGLGHSRVVKLLLDYGAQPNLQDSTGCSALHNSIPDGEDVVMLLLARGAQPSLKSEDSTSALSMAAFQRHYRIFNLLLKSTEVKVFDLWRALLLSSLLVTLQQENILMTHTLLLERCVEVARRNKIYYGKC